MQEDLERARIKRMERESERLQSMQQQDARRHERRLQMLDQEKSVNWKKDGPQQQLPPSVGQPPVNHSEEWLRRQQEVKEQRREQQLMASIDFYILILLSVTYFNKNVKISILLGGATENGT